MSRMIERVWRHLQENPRGILATQRREYGPDGPAGVKLIEVSVNIHEWGQSRYRLHPCGLLLHRSLRLPRVENMRGERHADSQTQERHAQGNSP